MRRARYSYWKKRRSPRRRSAPWDPPSTSKGANWTTDGSRRDWSTTTVAASVSSTAQVRTIENCSPIRMAPAVVRHQHCKGSADCVGCADAIDAPVNDRMSAKTDLLVLISLRPRHVVAPKARKHEIYSVSCLRVFVAVLTPLYAAAALR